MLSAVSEGTQPVPTPPIRPLLASKSPVSVWAGIALCLPLAVVQIACAGYQLGVGNQSIQIAFLKHLADPTLFSNDEMVRQTLPLYPSYFFQLLAPLLHYFALEPLFFFLHLLTTFATLATVYLLGRGIFRSHASALASVVLLIAGHHRALAGDSLYSPSFTHTYIALPMALAALAFAYRRRFLPAFALAGILFDLHALTGAYTLLMLAAALWIYTRESPWKTRLSQAAICGLTAIVLASPILFQMLHNHQLFDAQWINLMRVRSADHSFPNTWWQAGDTDLPRFALLLALFILSWSFAPLRRADSLRTLRMTKAMTLAILVLFAVGYVFTEIHPIPLIIRLQPFRASRLLIVLMFIHIAHAAIAAIRTGWTGHLSAEDGSSSRLATFTRIAEVLTGLLILATLAIPSLLPILPLTVAIATLVALTSARLSWFQAIISSAALLIAILAWRQIQFPLPFLSSEIAIVPHDWPTAPFVLATLSAAVILAIFLSLARRSLMRSVTLTLLVFAGLLSASALIKQQSFLSPNPNLAAVSQWANDHTAKDALFLAPTGLPNFRILANRSIVGDWRDGTQLYFSANFAPTWFSRLNDLEPGLALSPDNSRLLSRGQSIDTLDTDSLLALAQKYHASYILLPTAPANEIRPLEVAYTDPHFTAYTLKPSAIAKAVPTGTLNPNEWNAMQKFMADTVYPNIEKNRKADITIQITDPTGHPIQDLPITINQLRHAFNFGVSFGFFEFNKIDPDNDEKAAVVTPEQLKLAPTAFNASMIPFSGKWLYIEPVKGERHYSDLDKYVDYCTQNHMTIEYHFLAGLPPQWMESNEAAQVAAFPAHAMALLDRYHDTVKYWQLTNEGRLLRSVPEVYKAIHAKYPDVKFGVADCIKFFDDGSNMYPGVSMIPWLKSQGVKLDYFGIHGHRPYGLWADPRAMYKVFDTIAAMGVRLHVTEMLLPLGARIVGPVRKGVWTPPLEADFLADYVAVCFSHPQVDMVNFWGIGGEGWGPSSGLLDNKGVPRPAFTRLKQLITETWHTHVETQLPLDGRISARAFHGDYELTLALPDGSPLKSTFTIPQNAQDTFHFIYDAETKSLVNVNPPPVVDPIPMPATEPAPAATTKAAATKKSAPPSR